MFPLAKLIAIWVLVILILELTPWLASVLPGF